MERRGRVVGLWKRKEWRKIRKTEGWLVIKEEKGRVRKEMKKRRKRVG